MLRELIPWIQACANKRRGEAYESGTGTTRGPDGLAVANAIPGARYRRMDAPPARPAPRRRRGGDCHAPDVVAGPLSAGTMPVLL